MRLRSLLPLAMIALTAGLSAASSAPAKNDPVTPDSRLALPWWKARHELTLKRVAESPEKIRLVFVGDSITQGWETKGKAEWAANFAKYDALNLGFSGDGTEHVLWRLDNGEWPAALKPKVVVIMIGTNNTGHPPSAAPEATAEGVKRIVKKIRALSPESTILLHPIFPRGATPADKLRQINDKVNAIIGKLADGTHVKLVDFGAKFLDEKGGLPKSLMPDLLHPNAAGYTIWSAAITPEIEKLIPSETK